MSQNGSLPPFDLMKGVNREMYVDTMRGSRGWPNRPGPPLLKGTEEKRERERERDKDDAQKRKEKK